MNDFGYGGNILIVDVSDGAVEKRPSAPYTSEYSGGYGLALRLYWELVPPAAHYNDPENCLICASGPLAGFSGFAGSRWKMCATTPYRAPESFTSANLGDRWGTTLKQAGYDALVVRGKAEKPVYLYIHDNTVEVKDAAHLSGMTVFATIDTLKAELRGGVSVLAAGIAAEHQVPFATVGAEGGAVGSGGMGAVMGAKNIKAIAVAGDRQPPAADPERLRQLVREMRGYRPEEGPLRMWGLEGFTRFHACSGCGTGCSREVYTLTKGGRQYRALCQSSVFYQTWVSRYVDKDDGSRFLATRLCDGYGLDSTIIQTLIELLEACYKENMITEKSTDLPLSRIGTPEFIEKFTRKIAYKEGFGEILARGTIAAAEEIGPEATAMLHLFIANQANDKKDYDPRMLITTALCYATEPRRPIQQLHEIVTPVMMWNGEHSDTPGAKLPTGVLYRFAREAWGSAAAADFSTYEGKALAAKKIQDHACVKESMVTCDLGWLTVRFMHKLNPAETIAESEIYSAVTGKEIDEAEMDRTGEKIYNLQRALLLRQGWQGREGDSLLDYYFSEPLKQGELFYNVEAMVPGVNGEPLSRVGAVLDREKFEQMKTDYYELRGWDPVTGYPKREKLTELGLKDAADDLEARGLPV